MPANQYTLEVQQGATKTFVATMNQPGTSTPVNLTSYTAAMKIRPSWDSATVSLSLTNGSGITLGGALGTITVTLTAAQTAALGGTIVRNAAYVYDLEVTSAGGEVTKVARGTCLIYPEATR
jgi:Na+/serine symporter